MSNWVSLLNACHWGKPLLGKEQSGGKGINLPQKTTEARCSNELRTQQNESFLRVTIECITHVDLQNDLLWWQSRTLSRAACAAASHPPLVATTNWTSLVSESLNDWSWAYFNGQPLDCASISNWPDATIFFSAQIA